MLRIDFDSKDQFCTLVHPYNKRFDNFVRFHIKPLSYRRYDIKTHRWAVHFSKLATVVAFAKTQFDGVDYRSLPADLQIKLVAELAGRKTSITAEVAAGPMDAYQMLHLLPTAPPEVVKASYKALCFLNHPDRGGTNEQMCLLQEAFDELSKKHNPT